MNNIQPTMKFILLDTSQPELILALYNDQACLASIKTDLYPHSKFTTSLLEQMLKEHNTPLEALDFIAIGLGPGSFTGLRVSHVIAETLRFAIKLPIIPFNSLLLYAPIDSTCNHYLIVSDARKKRVYAQEVDCRDGQYDLSIPPYLAGIDEIENGNLPIFSPDPQLNGQFSKKNIGVAKINLDRLIPAICQAFSRHEEGKEPDLTIHYLKEPGK